MCHSNKDVKVLRSHGEYGLDLRSLEFKSGDVGLIPGWRAEIPHALLPKNPKHKTEAANLNRNSKTHSFRFNNVNSVPEDLEGPEEAKLIQAQFNSMGEFQTRLVDERDTSKEPVVSCPPEYQIPMRGQISSIQGGIHLLGLLQDLYDTSAVDTFGAYGVLPSKSLSR
ncbi:hypothetical protein MJT46_015454 [Ovis ammon polii x Ovis aries]|nr:hypothetical protein MJT46_015454 [Ovis ammon polii x Ovis aries]